EKILNFRIFVINYQIITMNTKNTKVSYKRKQLIEILCRIFLKMEICIYVLYKIQSVCFENLVAVFDAEVKVEFTLKRMLIY
ncbi:MAG: hypothetical protein LBC68_03955, partial [Prevotellaceae bacterium]|nr:hypothetical protein [Prevotellaceae bacterium]